VLSPTRAGRSPDPGGAPVSVAPPPTADDFGSAAELRAALRRFLHRSEEVTRLHGLTEQRYQLLLQVKALGPAATVTRLVEPLQIGQSAVTQLVNRAEQLGLLFRLRATGDARVSRLLLTEEGETRLRAAFEDLRGERERLLELVSELGPV
jgi:DNA-binding MarR family transcriptional regulator